MANNFNVEKCKNRLLTTWVGTDFNYIEQTASTNSFVKVIPSDELIHGAVYLADIQKNGRGQYERTWEAAPFLNLTFTLSFKPPGGDRLPLLSLSVATAISKVVEAYTNEPVRLKWPNDLICKEKKIGGLLTEAAFYGSKIDRVLIGIGLNVNQVVFSKEIDDKTTSMKTITRCNISREQLLAAILNEIELSYHKWHLNNLELLREVNNKLIGYGDWVKISIYDELKPDLYKFIGVTEKGELLMLNGQMDVNKFCYEQIRIFPGSQNVSKASRELSA